MRLTCPRCSATIKSKQIDIEITKAHCNECNFLFDVIGEIYRDRFLKKKSQNIPLYSPPIQLLELADNGLLECAECQTKIPQKHINNQEKLAVCPTCDHMFDLSVERYEFYSSSRGAISQISSISGLEFLDFETEMSFKYREKTREVNSNLFNILTIVVILGVFLLLSVPSPWNIIGIVIAGLIAIYFLSIRKFNSKLIHVNAHHITIKNVPYNTGEDLKIAKKDVVQLLAHMYQSSDSTPRTPSYLYAFSILNERGGRQDLAKDFEKPDIPLFIKNKIEEFWGM